MIYVIRAMINLSDMGYFCNFLLPHKVYYQNGLMTFICSDEYLAEHVKEQALNLAVE